MLVGHNAYITKVLDLIPVDTVLNICVLTVSSFQGSVFG